MEKIKIWTKKELKAQQEETLDNVATTQQDEGDKTEEQPAKEMSVEDKLAAAETKSGRTARQIPASGCRIWQLPQTYHQRKGWIDFKRGGKNNYGHTAVLDDMERALKNMDKMEDVAAVKEGVDLIFQKFVKVLGEQGSRK